MRRARGRRQVSTQASTCAGAAAGALWPKRARRPAAAPPRVPVTARTSPTLPAPRRSARSGSTDPPAQTSTTSGPRMPLRSPPTRRQPVASASSRSPRARARTSSSTVSAGAHSVAVHQAALAPIAARSLSATARQRRPSWWGVIHSRRKSSPSTRASWVTTTARWGGGCHTAASSPGPMRTPPLMTPAASPARRAITAPSPTSARVVPGSSKRRARSVAVRSRPSPGAGSRPPPRG